MQKLAPADKKIFDKAYGSLQFPLAEHSFAWLYLWDGCYGEMEWALINGNLCLFLTFEGKRCIWGPVVPGKKLADTLGRCFSMCEDYNAERGIPENPAMMYIPEELKDAYANLSGFKLQEQNQDYIYKRTDIIELKGDSYKSKRNLKNYFMKNYSCAVEQYNAGRHRAGCLDLLHRWKEQKLETIEDADVEKLDAEVAANERALELANTLGLKGVVVLVDGKVQGYSFAERTSSIICTDFFEKTNLRIKGLSVFIYGELMKLFDCEYVNAGEDWDVKYLERIKRSYRPHLIKKSYSLVKNGAD